LNFEFLIFICAAVTAGTAKFIPAPERRCRSNCCDFKAAENYRVKPRFAQRIIRAVKSELSMLPVLSVASLLAFERSVRGAREAV
jgi:hypothetical protein